MGETQESDERQAAWLHLAWDSANDAMVLSDPDGIVLAANPAYYALYGYSPAEILGNHFAIIFPAAVRDTAATLYRDIFHGPHDQGTHRSTVQRKDGTERIVEARTGFVEDGGRRVAMLSVVRDITEQVHAETALQRRNERLALLGEASAHLLESDRPQETVRALYERLSTALGLEVYFNYVVADDAAMDGSHAPGSTQSAGEGELRLAAYGGIPAATAQAIDRLAFNQTMCGTVAARRQSLIAEDVQHSRDPLTALVRELGITAYACFPLLAHGRLVGTLSFGTRERPRFEPDEIDLMQTIANQAAIALERARLADQTREALQSRDAILATVSHDLRTPLSAIQGYAQMIERILQRPQPGAHDDSGHARFGDYVASIRTAARRMEAQIEELQDVARLQVGTALPLRRRPTDLVSLIRQAASVLSGQDGQHGGRCIVVDAAVPELIGHWDADRLERVVVNLLSNAVKYSSPESEIRVTVTVQPNQNGTEGDARGRPVGTALAVLAVRDHGIGIPASELPRIFTMFHRAGNVGDEVLGSGVGLASAHAIVAQHGGVMTVDSVEGQGSTFTVTLPLEPPR